MNMLHKQVDNSCTLMNKIQDNQAARESELKHNNMMKTQIKRYFRNH